jgi:type III pantothenate kinase
MMILTVDIGNSRIKWAQWLAGTIIARGVQAYDKGEVSAALGLVFSGVEQPACVYAVCVAGEQVASSLSDWVAANWQCDIDFLVTQEKFEDITHAYDKPEHHGADRWAALVAARRLYPDESVCVIGAGTAITVDMLNRDGQHLGGYILPSFDTMQAALLASTDKVGSAMPAYENNLQASSLDDSVEAEQVPRDTAQAVEQGLHRLVRAGIRDMCELAGRVLDQPQKIVLTGGAAKTILGYPDMPAMSHCPDLVMQGLYMILNNRDRGQENQSGSQQPGSQWTGKNNKQ